MEGSFEPYPGLLGMVKKKREKKLPWIILLKSLPRKKTGSVSET